MQLFTDQQSIQLGLSTEERQYFSGLFQRTDQGNKGRILGQEAAQLFKRSRLTDQILATVSTLTYIHPHAVYVMQIWQRADSEQTGSLSPAGFCRAMRMISLAQQQRPILDGEESRPQALPKLESLESFMNNPQTMSGGLMNSAVNTANVTTDLGPLQPTAEERQRFSDLFNRSAKQGLLDGQAARQLFIKSNLPPETLAQIW
jgi:epidermal growth factor receptor substrate 15